MATRTASRVGRASARKRRKGPFWWRLLKISASVLVLIVLVSGTIGGVVFLLAFKRAEERVASLFEKLDEIPSHRTQIIATDPQTLKTITLYTATEQFRMPIHSYDGIPETVVNATLAAEDKRFFQHDGVDPIAVIRSLFVNLREGRTSEGASTITMQLSKRMFTSSEQSFERKLDDAAIAIQIERMITKREILRTYLNQAYYGSGAYGIKAAANVYFGKSLKQLTVAEAALLARCVRRPSDQNPFANLDRAIRNRDVVLAIMREEGMISQAEYKEAVAEVPRLNAKQFAAGERIRSHPYFTRFVIDWLKDNAPELDLAKGGYTIETTLDPGLQEAAGREVQNVVRRNRRAGVQTGAVVILASDGRVLAMQGGVDYRRNQYNVAYQGGRQPGSSFKPFVYAAALANGAISWGDRISNDPFVWGDWRPQNSGGRSGGTFSISDALAQSRNLPAIHVTQKVGPDTAALYAKDVFGFRSKILPVKSMALGTNPVTPLEMAEGYSVFQSGGDRIRAFPVTRIIGPNKEVVRTWEPMIARKVLDSRVADAMDRTLQYVVTNGTGKEARAISDARGKTGTTQENRDAWFVGYTNNLICAAWIANEQFDERRKRWVYRPMSSYVMGGTVAVDLWRETMRHAQARHGRGADRERNPEMNRDMFVSVEATSEDQAPEPEVTPTPAEETPADPPESVPTESPVPFEETPAAPPVTNELPAKVETASVSVEICADTNERATMYCPETVTRQYSNGRAPRRYCRKHSPPN